MSKRDRGDGSIRQRKNGKFEARLRYIDPVTGLAERLSLYGDTRADVTAKLREAQLHLVRREQPQPEAVRLSDFLDRWLEDVVQPSQRDSTYRSYKIAVDLHIKPSRLGLMLLRDLREVQIQHVFVAKSKEPTRTQVLTLIVLRRALDRAVQWGLLDKNPAKYVSMPRRTRKELKPLTAAQVQRFLDAAADDRLYALYYLAIHTGMRQGELLALRWDDIVDGTIRVQRQLDAHTRKLVPPKTRAARRPVTLSVGARAALKAHKARQRADGYSGPYVFVDIDGGLLRPSNYQRRSFKPLLKKAKIDSSVRFHDLRHTSATFMLAAGVNPKIAAERLGHANVGITMDFYQHVSTDLQREAAAAMDGLLKSAARSTPGRNGRKAGGTKPKKVRKREKSLAE